MPEFTGSTDEKHVFTLPSEIERVRWLRRQAAPGGQVGLQIRTVFCAPGSQMKVTLEDAQGTVHNTLSGKLPGRDLTLDLRVPTEATGGLLAKVELPNHGLSAESEALPLTTPVRVRNAQWSASKVQPGDVLTLSADAEGAPDGRRAQVRIFERDPGRGAHDPVTQLRPRVENGRVEGMYAFQYPGDTDDIVPEWEAPEGYRQPEFFFRVDVSGIQAESGLLTFEDNVESALKDDQGQPRTDLKSVTLKQPDGQEVQTEPDEEGVITLANVPPGPFKIVDYTLKEQSGSGSGA